MAVAAYCYYEKVCRAMRTAIVSYLRKNFTLIVQLMLTLSIGQADVECGFSLNDKLLVENMQEQSMIAQRVIKAHLLSNGYLPHNVPITRDVTKKFNNS